MENIKKLFVVILIFFNFTIVSSFAEVINKIDVKGNKRISAETIIVFGR